jgi:hypothetical protein
MCLLSADKEIYERINFIIERGKKSIKGETEKRKLINILLSKTCTELECIWPLMIVLLAILSLLSDQSLKFSIVEDGAFVGGVDTIRENEKKWQFCYLRVAK